MRECELDVGKLPSPKQWDEWRAERPEEELPHSSTIARAFGSWGQAKAKAERVARPTSPFPTHRLKDAKGPRTRGWSDVELVDLIRVAGDDLGRAPTPREWDEAKRRPLAATIIKRLGWRNAVLAAGLKPASEGPRSDVDRATIVLRIRWLAAELGHPPSKAEWKAQANPPCSVDLVESRFETYGAALKEAGFTYGRGGNRTIPKVEILQAIQDVAAQHGYLPRVREWLALTDDVPVSMRTIENTFGTYSRAAVAAGFVAPLRGGNQSAYRPSGSLDEREIVEALVAYLSRYRRTPTLRTWKAAALTPTVGRIETIFGTWGKALHAAMIEAREGSDVTIPADVLLHVLRADKVKLGRWPTADEYRNGESPRPSINTLIGRFGSWDNAKKEARPYEPGSRIWVGGNLSPSSRVTAA